MKHLTTWRQAATVAVVAILIASAAVGAASTLFTADPGVTYIAENGQEDIAVTVNEPHNQTAANPIGEFGTITIEGHEFSGVVDQETFFFTVEQLPSGPDERVRITNISGDTDGTRSDRDFARVFPANREGFLSFRAGLDQASFERVEVDGTSTGSFTDPDGGALYQLNPRSSLQGQRYAAATPDGTVLDNGTFDSTPRLLFFAPARATETEIIVLEPSAPQLNRAPDSKTVDSEQANITVDVADTDAQTETTSLTDVQLLVDGELNDSVTVQNNARITLQTNALPDDTYNYTLTAEDQFNESAVNATGTITVEHANPQVDAASATPANNKFVSKRQVDFSVNVSDGDFAPGRDGDALTADVYLNDRRIDTQTLNSNGTIATTETINIGGQSEWFVEVTDEYGNTVRSQNFTFRLPAELEIRDVQDPDQLITSTGTAEVTFFSQDSETVETREVTNGTVGFAGLPLNERFIALVNVEGFRERRVLIPSLTEQSDAFLLSENATANQVEFRLEDNTGKFGTSETTLILSRPVTKNNSTEFRVIAGDRFGASSTLPFQLAQDERVRIEIRNDNGEVRKLGAFTVSRDQLVPLEVGSLEFPVENESTFQAEADRQEIDDSTDELVFEYRDPTKQTDEIDVKIVNVNNESQVLTTDRETGPLGTYRLTVQVSGAERNESWQANWTAQRGEETVGAVEQFGAEQYPIGIPIDSGWRQIFAVGLIVTVAGLFSVANARIGAIVVPGVAGVLWYVGWMSGIAGAASVVIALSLGVAYNLAIARGVPT